MTKEQQDELYQQHHQNIAINDLTEDEASELIEKLDRDREAISLHHAEQEWQEYLEFMCEEEIKEIKEMERVLDTSIWC